MTRTRPLRYRQPPEHEQHLVACPVRGCSFKGERDPQGDATEFVTRWLDHAREAHGIDVQQGTPTLQDGTSHRAPSACRGCGASETTCDHKAAVCGRPCCDRCDHDTTETT